jgi:hypothetical protein
MRCCGLRGGSIVHRVDPLVRAQADAGLREVGDHFFDVAEHLEAVADAALLHALIDLIKPQVEECRQRRQSKDRHDSAHPADAAHRQ